ncbi:MAG TPA: glycosyltransferase [Chitinophagaceae bacterium]|nr:glycosyltransferase [Chitinophagaceae bacterium]
MKSVIIIGTAFPLRGGLAAYNERLARELLGQGHRVVIFTFSLQYPSFLFPGKSQYSQSPPPEGLDIRVRINSINPLNWISTGMEIRSLRPDLVIVKFWIPFMGPSLGTLLRIIRLRRHTRVVSILDNVIPHEKRFADRAFTKYFFRPVDAFVAMSRQVMQELSRFSSKPVSLVAHPLYDNYGPPVARVSARDQLQLPREGRYLLFFGFIRAYKGLDLLLEAMADPRLSGINLIIAGECYEDRDRYEALWSVPSLKGRISLFTDFIPADQVRYFFCAADLVVQPYRSATQSGISQIAFQYEKPMIVTRVGGLAEIIKDRINGLVCEPNPPSIVAAIAAYFSEGLEPVLTENLRQEKSRYGWDPMVREILRLAFEPSKPKPDHS